MSTAAGGRSLEPRLAQSRRSRPGFLLLRQSGDRDHRGHGHDDKDDASRRMTGSRGKKSGTIGPGGMCARINAPTPAAVKEKSARFSRFLSPRRERGVKIR